ncbi:MAG: cereblon family protein [Gammaproteobacteria bacterium]|nr:cereblon family protein [Gammaproteobacteria bacterium]
MANRYVNFFRCNLFDAATRKLRKPKPRKADENSDQKLLCRICEQAVSSENNRIPVNASHDHTCINPAGIEFHIGCFDQAPGCAPVGPASFEHTWFAGHAWQVTVCKNCHEHLGWYFRNSTSFYGLILNKLKNS